MVSIGGHGITSQECNTKWRGFICSPNAPLAQDPANQDRAVNYCVTGILPTTCHGVDTFEIACKPPTVARPPPSRLPRGDQPPDVIVAKPIPSKPYHYTLPLLRAHASTAKPINIECTWLCP